MPKLTQAGGRVELFVLVSGRQRGALVALDLAEKINVRLIVLAMLISHDIVFFSHNKTASAGL